MLSDKIKSKSALKAQTFLHFIHAIPITFFGEIVTLTKHSIHRIDSAMINQINIDCLCHRYKTDMPWMGGLNKLGRGPLGDATLSNI